MFSLVYWLTWLFYRLIGKFPRLRRIPSVRWLLIILRRKQLRELGNAEQANLLEIVEELVEKGIITVKDRCWPVLKPLTEAVKLEVLTLSLISGAYPDNSDPQLQANKKIVAFLEEETGKTD